MSKLAFFVTTLLCFSATAQWPPLPVDHDDLLAIKATVQHGRQSRILVQLTNRSSHDVLLPLPVRDCADSVRGSLWISTMILKPERDLTGHGCVNDYINTSASVEKRIHGWFRLTPGKSMQFIGDIPSKAALLAGRVTLEFNARYDPPSMPKADLDLLARAHIQAPQQELSTGWHTVILRKRR